MAGSRTSSSCAGATTTRKTSRKLPRPRATRCGQVALQRSWWAALRVTARATREASLRLAPPPPLAVMLSQVTSVQGHDEAVVLIAEVRDDSARGHAAVVDAVTTAISSEHGVTLSRLCLLKQKSVPKTTSGKIARRWCSKALREQTLSIVHEWSSGETTGAHARRARK